MFRLALSESRRLEVIHSNGDAHLLDVDAQPHPRCQTAADMQASPTVTASLSCWTTRAAMPALLDMDTQREPLRGVENQGAVSG